MKFAAFIVIALHLLALVAVSQTMLTLAESEPNSGFSDADVRNDGCECSGGVCGCCVNIVIGKFCLNLKYLPEISGLRVAININDEQLISVDIPAKNPPPVCLDLKLGKACLKLGDMQYDFKYIKGYLRVVIETFIQDFTVDIGSFELLTGLRNKDSEKSED